MADDSLPRMAADLAELERLRQQQPLDLSQTGGLQSLGGMPQSVPSFDFQPTPPPAPTPKPRVDPMSGYKNVPTAGEARDATSLLGNEQQIAIARDLGSTSPESEAGSLWGNLATEGGKRSLDVMGAGFDSTVGAVKDVARAGINWATYKPEEAQRYWESAGHRLMKFPQSAAHSREAIDDLVREWDGGSPRTPEHASPVYSPGAPPNIEDMLKYGKEAGESHRPLVDRVGAGLMAAGEGLYELLGTPAPAKGGFLGKALDPLGAVARAGVSAATKYAPKTVAAINRIPAATPGVMASLAGKAGTAAKEYVQGIPEAVNASARGEMAPSVFFGPPSAKGQRKPVLTPQEANVKGEYAEEWRQLREPERKTLSTDAGLDEGRRMQIAERPRGEADYASSDIDQYRDRVLTKIVGELNNRGLGETHSPEDVLAAAQRPLDANDPVSVLANEITKGVGPEAVQWDLANAGRGGFHMLPEYKGKAAMDLPPEGVEMFPGKYAEKYGNEFTPEQMRAAYENEAWKRAQDLEGVPKESKEANLAKEVVDTQIAKGWLDRHKLPKHKREAMEEKVARKFRNNPEKVAEIEAWAASQSAPATARRPHVEAEELLDRGVENLRATGFGKPMGPDPLVPVVPEPPPPITQAPPPQAAPTVESSLAGLTRSNEAPRDVAGYSTPEEAGVHWQATSNAAEQPGAGASNGIDLPLTEHAPQLNGKLPVLEALKGRARKPQPEGPLTYEDTMSQVRKETLRYSDPKTGFNRMRGVGGVDELPSAPYGVTPPKMKRVTSPEVREVQTAKGYKRTQQGRYYTEKMRNFDTYMRNDRLPSGGGLTQERFPRQGKFFWDDDVPSYGDTQPFKYSDLDVIARQGQGGPTSQKFVNHGNRAIDTALADTAASKKELYRIEDVVEGNGKAYREGTGQDYIEGKNGLLFSKTQGIDHAFNPNTPAGKRFFKLTGLHPDQFKFETKEMQELADFFKREYGVKRGQRAEELGITQDGGQRFTATPGGEVFPRRYEPSFKQYAHEGDAVFDEINAAMEATFGKGFRLKGEDVLNKIEKHGDRPVNMEQARTLPYLPIGKRMSDGTIIRIQKPNLVRIGNEEISPIERILHSTDQRLAAVEEFGQNPPAKLQTALAKEGVDPKAYGRVIEGLHDRVGGIKPEDDPIHQIAGEGAGMLGQISRAVMRHFIRDVKLSAAGAKSTFQIASEVPANAGHRNVIKTLASMAAEVPERLAYGYAEGGSYERAVESGAQVRRRQVLPMFSLLTKNGRDIMRASLDKNKMTESLIDAVMSRISPAAYLKRGATAVGDFSQAAAAKSHEFMMMEAARQAQQSGEVGRRIRSTLRDLRFPDYLTDRIGFAGPEEMQRLVDSVMARGAFRTQFRDMPRAMKGKWQNDSTVNLIMPFREYAWNTVKRRFEALYNIGRDMRNGDWKDAANQTFRMFSQIMGLGVAGIAAGQVAAWSRGQSRKDESYIKYCLNNLLHAGILGPLQYLADIATYAYTGGKQRTPVDPFGNIYLDTIEKGVKGIGAAAGKLGKGKIEEAPAAFAKEAVDIGAVGRGVARSLDLMDPAGEQKKPAGTREAKSGSRISDMLDGFEIPKRKRISESFDIEGPSLGDMIRTLEAPARKKRISELLDED